MSVADFLPEARYQRCMVHFYRNVFSHVPSTRVREVSHMLKAIHAQESHEAADKKAQAIVEDLRATKMGKAGFWYTLKQRGAGRPNDDPVHQTQRLERRADARGPG